MLLADLNLAPRGARWNIASKSRFLISIKKPIAANG